MTFISHISKDNHVKIKTCELDLNLKDISIKAKGDRRECFYAESYYHWLNVRGGSFYQLNKTAIIARKGLPKIFDLKYDYVDEKAKFEKNKKKDYDKMMKSRIFEEVEQKLKQNQKVKLK